MAVLLTWVLILLWAAGGSAVLRLCRYRWSLATLLLAPSVGMATLVVATYILVRFGVRVGVLALPLVAILMLLIPVSLWSLRPTPPQLRLVGRQGWPFALILIAAFGLTAWPMFSYGFDWVANGNDDMANYCVSATGYRDHGYTTVPNASELKDGTDLTKAQWFAYRLREARQGAEVLLALVAVWTGLEAVQVFMPVIVALNLALISAAAGLVLAGTRRRAVAAATALLLTVSSQITNGVVEQLIAQAGGLALLCTALAMVTKSFGRMAIGLILQRAVASGVVFAAMTVFYPEVIPLLVGACVVLGVRDLIRRRLNKRHLLHAGAAIAVMAALLPVYVSATARFILVVQGTQGIRSADWVKEVFPFYLTPRAGALVWGLLPNAGPESLAFQTVVEIVALPLIVLLALTMFAGVVRGRVAAAVLAVGAVMWTVLFLQSGAFGLFKLAMFLQPFLWAVMAAWVLSRRSRVGKAVACGLLAVVAIQNARVQYWYVDQSRGQDCRVALPAVSYRHGLDEFRSDFARQKARGVDQVLVASDNVVLMKLLVAETHGVPTGILGPNPFDKQVRDMLPVLEDEPLAKQHREWSGSLNTLREQYLAGNPSGLGPVLRDPDTGETLHRLIAEQPDRSAHPANRILVVAPGGALSVFNRHRHPPEGPLVVCAPLAELRNFAVFCDATGARQYFMGMQEASEVGMHRLESDYSFRKQTTVGVGRAVVMDVLSPSPRVRVLVSATGSFRTDPRARNAPPVRVVGDQRVPLGAVGIGAVRLVSPPITPQKVGPGRYITLEFGEPTRNVNQISAVEQFWNAELPRDRRWLTGHVRDISILSEAEYAAFQPPESVAKFPADLAHPHLEFTGFSEDGWIGKEARIRLTAPHGKQECVIRGMVPGLPGGEGFRTELTVFLEGTAVERRLLKPGEFEVRGAVGPNAGPQWVELRFSHVQLSPAPDYRPLAAHIHFIGFESKDETRSRPPEKISTFPADLNHPKLEQTGIHADGWCANTFRVRLAQPATGSEVVLRGEIPAVTKGGTFQTDLVVLLDGAEIVRRTLGFGAFEVRAPVRTTAQAHWIECRFTHTQGLPPPDGRNVGALLRFIGFTQPQPTP